MCGELVVAPRAIFSGGDMHVPGASQGPAVSGIIGSAIGLQGNADSAYVGER